MMFTFPLKFLCKLCGAPYLVLLVLSGLIAYIDTILYQILKYINKNTSSGVGKFIRIFSINICLTFFVAVIVHPFIPIYIIIGCEVLSITPIIDSLHNLLTKPLAMEGDVSPDGITDKSKGSPSNTGANMYMDNKGIPSDSTLIQGKDS